MANLHQLRNFLYLHEYCNHPQIYDCLPLLEHFEMNPIDLLIDNLNSHRQETIDRLQSRWQDATLKLMLGILLWYSFYRQNNQWTFWAGFGIATLINIGISIWLNRLFPPITQIGLAGDDSFIDGTAGEKIEAGTAIYKKGGKWYSAMEKYANE